MGCSQSFPNCSGKSHGPSAYRRRAFRLTFISSPTQSSTGRTPQRHFPKVPYRPALFIWDGGTPAVYTYRKPDLDVDLRHECTHALLHSVLPVVPLWLDEGLAKYFEVPHKQRASGHPYFDDLKWKWSLRLGMVRTIESLEQRQNLTEMDAADYRYSWAWVHFMLHGPKPAHQALVNYVACYQQSVPAGKLSARLAAAVPNSTETNDSAFQALARVITALNTVNCVLQSEQKSCSGLNDQVAR